MPPAVYGVLQHLGLDPIPWTGMAAERVSSTAGNSIFIGAYLIMVVPLTLARIILGLTAVTSALRQWPSTSAVMRGTRWAVCYLLVVGAGVAAIVATNLRSSWADAFAKHGAFYEEQGQWVAAATAYEEALRLRPGAATAI